MFSNAVSCLFVDVLAGTIRRGDPVELVRPDGSTVLVVGKTLREGLGQSVLDLDDPHPAKEALGAVEIARTPGLRSPSLSSGDTAAGVASLVEAARSARAAGFHEDQAHPLKPVFTVTPAAICALMRQLPDEAVALLVLKRVRHALSRHANPADTMPACQVAAMHLGAIGLREDGDRLLLAASAAIQGRKADPALQAAAAVVATGMVAMNQASETAGALGQRAAWALGLEMGDAFAMSFQRSFAVQGEEMETLLLQAGRAVGVGWCKRCRDVVQLRVGRSGLTSSRELRCPNDDQKVGDATIVVPADAPATQETLRRIRR
jgi:hypothetical protein